MIHKIELGVDTFGDITEDADGKLLHAAQVIRNMVEEAALADEVGVDFIGVGEHHRADFAVSSPEIVLAAIASRTRRIRLGSAVSVLSSDDPIRVFQRFASPACRQQLEAQSHQPLSERNETLLVTQAQQCTADGRHRRWLSDREISESEHRNGMLLLSRKAVKRSALQARQLHNLC